jgi:hypothetical protein
MTLVLSEPKSYSVFIPEGGLGKIIASTAVAAAIKANHPERDLIVVTPWPEVYLNNPNVARVYRSGAHPYFYRDYIQDKDTLIFKNEPYFTAAHIQKKQHVIISWCELFKLKYNNETPRLYFNARELENVQQKYANPKPIMIFQTCGGAWASQKPYSWTRDFPIYQAQQVVDAFKDTHHIIQVSRPTGFKLNGTEALPEIGKREFMAMLLMSKKRLLIDSSMQHAAATLGLPSTVAWVGTSHTTFGYNIHDNIYPTAKRDMEHLIDSFIFDYNFDGQDHEYPYSTNELFDVNAIIASVKNQGT